MSYFIFKEKPTLRKVLAMCVTIMGVTFTATGGVFDLGKLSLYGIFMGLICGFCFASLAITSRLGGQSEDTTAMTFYTMVFGLIALAIYGSIVGIGEFHADGKLALISIINGSTSVALPYFMYGFAITRLKHGPWRVVGIVLVITSIAMINMPERSKCTLKSPGCE